MIRLDKAKNCVDVMSYGKARNWIEPSRRGIATIGIYTTRNGYDPNGSERIWPRTALLFLDPIRQRIARDDWERRATAKQSMVSKRQIILILLTQNNDREETKWQQEQQLKKLRQST